MHKKYPTVLDKIHSFLLRPFPQSKEARASNWFSFRRLPPLEHTSTSFPINLKDGYLQLQYLQKRTKEDNIISVLEIYSPIIRNEQRRTSSLDCFLIKFLSEKIWHFFSSARFLTV